MMLLWNRRFNMFRKALACGLMVFFQAAPTLSDEIRPAYLEVNETEAGGLCNPVESACDG